MKTDVIVIGGGVAGSAVAFFLALQKLRVTVLDKARFPRDKICTSTVNPYTLSYLLKMGVMKELLGDGMLPIEGMQGFNYEGRSFKGYYGSQHYPYVNYGHTIPRYRLDEAMSNRIRQLNDVTLVEDFHVNEILFNEEGRAIGVQGQREGHVETLYADMIIDAAGRGSVLARANGWFEPVLDHERYAVVCQFEGVCPPDPLFTIGTNSTIGPGYYCVFPITERTAIIGFIVDPKVYAQVKADPNGFVDQFVRRPDWAGHEWLLQATRATDVVTFGPLAFNTRQVQQSGVLLVGDTTGFYDPLTGEGIGFAIRSGEMAAETVVRLLSGGCDWDAEHERYQETLLQDKRERTEQVVQMHRMLKRPLAYNRFVDALSSNQQAADWAARSFANMLAPEEKQQGGLLTLVTNRT